MADFTTRTVRTARHETAVPSPATWPEMEKAVSNVRQQLAEAGKDVRDDTIRVETRDDEIVLYWIEAEQ
jgi:hypothetical protein